MRIHLASGAEPDCDSLWDLLSACADGEASPEEMALVRGHAARCEACARDLRFLEETSRALAIQPEIAPPPTLRESILAATVHRPSLAARLLEACGRLLVARPGAEMAFAGGAAAAVLLAVIAAPRQGTGPALPAPVAVAQAPSRPDRPHTTARRDQNPRRVEPGGRPAARPRPAASAEPARGPIRVAAIPGRAQARISPIPMASASVELAARSLRPRARRAVPHYKPALAEPPLPSTPEPDEVREEEGMAPGDGMPMMAETHGTDLPMPRLDPAPPAPSPAPVPARLRLVAGGLPISAGAAATLADLKRQLRAEGERFREGVAGASLEDRRQIQVDLVRGRF